MESAEVFALNLHPLGGGGETSFMDPKLYVQSADRGSGKCIPLSGINIELNFKTL